MSLSAYQKSVLKLRNVPLTLTKETEGRLDVALRQAWAELEALIQESSSGDLLQRKLYEAKRDRLAVLINELALTLKKETVNGTEQTAKRVVEVREDETNRLIREQGLPMVADFSDVPRRTLEMLAQRIDTEGLKISSNIWAQMQMKTIENEVLAAVARGTSAFELSQRLRGFVLGTGDLTAQELLDLRRVKGVERRKLGTSIAAKAKRLARTEINTAYWEASRLSADESPVVGAIKWNLSNRHIKWDVCDILAGENLFALGAGVYPPSALPPKPHPNDLCYQTDILRPVSEWDKPKPAATLHTNVDDLAAAARMAKGAQGSPHFIASQMKAFKELVKATLESQGIVPAGRISSRTMT